MSSPGAIAFQLGPIVVRWYGILMALAIVVGLWLGHREARKEGLPADDIISAGQWSILAVWEGGLAIHGGLIVGPLVGAWLASRWKLPVLRGLDVAAPCIAIGQAIGRWGNFFNEEAFGAPTNLPWKLYISPEHRPPGFARYDYFHPTFLYESLWDLGVFVVLFALTRSRLHLAPGAIFFSYIGLYSVGRFVIEAVRLDSFWIGPFRVAQLASLLGIAISIAGLAWTRRHSSRGASTAPLETPP